MIGEFDRIARYFVPLAAAPSLGLNDDAACLRPDPARDQIITVDQMLEGVHFLADDPPDLIARKLLRRNLSDLAAMGATPLHYLLTTALRADTPEPWLAQFAQGLAEDQARYHVTLIGGDSTATPRPARLQRHHDWHNPTRQRAPPQRRAERRRHFRHRHHR